MVLLEPGTLKRLVARIRTAGFWPRLSSILDFHRHGDVTILAQTKRGLKTAPQPRRLTVHVWNITTDIRYDNFKTIVPELASSESNNASTPNIRIRPSHFLSTMLPRKDGMLMIHMSSERFLADFGLLNNFTNLEYPWLWCPIRNTSATRDEGG